MLINHKVASYDRVCALLDAFELAGIRATADAPPSGLLWYTVTVECSAASAAVFLKFVHGRNLLAVL